MRPIPAVFCFLTIALLSGCVGVSGIYSTEGVHLDSPDNSYQVPIRVEYFMDGYTTENNRDPGHPVYFKDSQSYLSTNCLKKERGVSFMPSVIIPLPPALPWFGADEKIVDRKLEISISRCNSSSESEYFVDHIKVNNDSLQPSKITKADFKSFNLCTFHFQIQCSELTGGSKIILKRDLAEKEVDIEYKKTYNFGWFWFY